MDVSAALGQAARLEPLIDDIFGISAYDEHAGHKDSRQIFLVDELWPNMRKLADAAVKIEYLSHPAKEVDTRYRNKDGEYETGQGYACRSGSQIEALLQDGSLQGADGGWRDGEDYCLARYRGIPLEGLSVRVG